MKDPQRKPGDPYCSNCGYTLVGAVDSSKCPECGKPLVEVLERHEVKMSYSGKRYRATTQVMGLPLIDIALGPVEGEPKGKARGFIAIGDEATGWLALGGMARGFVALGGFALGVFSAGGMSIGLGSAVGGCAIGGMAAGGAAIGGLASGGGAVGGVAQGGAAVGLYARGGGVFGPNTIGPQGASSPDVANVFGSLDWFFGTGWPNSVLSHFQPMVLLFVLVVVMGLLVSTVAWAKWARHGPGEMMRSR